MDIQEYENSEKQEYPADEHDQEPLSVEQIQIDTSKQTVETPTTPHSRGGDSSPEREMRFDASPFVPTQANLQQPASVQVQEEAEESKQENVSPTKSEGEPLSPLTSQKLLLQEKLEKQIKVMKAQHQFIQNLQRANLHLKQKLKQLEDASTSQQNNDSAQRVREGDDRQMMTQGDIADETNFQEMDLVPLGPIEHLNKQERARSKNRDHDGSPYKQHRGDRSHSASRYYHQYPMQDYMSMMMPPVPHYEQPRRHMRREPRDGYKYEDNGSRHQERQFDRHQAPRGGRGGRNQRRYEPYYQEEQPREFSGSPQQHHDQHPSRHHNRREPQYQEDSRQMNGQRRGGGRNFKPHRQHDERPQPNGNGRHHDERPYLNGPRMRGPPMHYQMPPAAYFYQPGPQHHHQHPNGNSHRNMLQPIDHSPQGFYDAPPYHHNEGQQIDMRPAQYYQSVTKRAKDFESSRNGGSYYEARGAHGGPRRGRQGFRGGHKGDQRNQKLEWMDQEEKERSTSPERGIRPEEDAFEEMAAEAHFREQREVEEEQVMAPKNLSEDEQ